MAAYRPAIQLQLQAGCKLGPLSCTSFSFAMAGDRATLGKVVPKGCDVRKATGDTVGGTTLRQNAAALLAQWEIGLSSVFYGSFEDFLGHLSEGRGAVIQFAYGLIRESIFRGSESFTGGHAAFVNEYDKSAGKVLVYDPLADGRRAGIAKGPDWWPVSLLKAAAGGLKVNAAGTRVGFGKAWWAYTKVTSPVSHPDPVATTDYGENAMIAAIERFDDSAYVMSLKAGQTLYREPKIGAKPVTKMVAASNVPVVGNAASGWKAVVIFTGVPYHDKVGRPTVLYVPATAGKVSAR